MNHEDTTIDLDLDGPTDGDYVIADARRGYEVSIFGEKFCGTFNSRDSAEAWIAEDMGTQSYWSSVWVLSDHGNFIPGRMTMKTETGTKIDPTPKGYQGWTNYETWAVNLWIGNEEPAYRFWREQAAQIRKRANRDTKRPHLTAEERARFDLADALKDHLVSGNPLADKPSVYSDLLSAAMSEVNWDEVAASLLEE